MTTPCSDSLQPSDVPESYNSLKSKVLQALLENGTLKRIEEELKTAFSTVEVTKILDENSVDIDVDIRVVSMDPDVLQNPVLENSVNNEVQDDSKTVVLGLTSTATTRSRRGRRPRITVGEECYLVNGNVVCP